MTGRVEVNEAVPGPGADPFDAHLLRREQHRVVQALEPGGGTEGFEEPWRDDPVVDDGVPADG